LPSAVTVNAAFVDERSIVSVGDLLESLLQETGYFESLEAERTIEAQGRLENLHELIGVGREFDANWEATLQLRNQVAHFADVKRASGNEEYMIGFDRTIFGCDRGTFHNGQ